MAWNCTLYSNFKKRVNSTRRPTGGGVFPCRIKNETDFKNPTFEIAADDLSAVNYMQFNGQYFYVTSVRSLRTGIWEVTGVRDPMATFKEDIQATTSLVLYNQTGTDVGGSSWKVPDERIPISRAPSFYSETALITGSFYASPTQGSYILSAVGENSGVITYILSQAAMSALISGLNAEVSTRAAGYFEPSQYPADEIAALNFIKNGLYYVLKQELAYGNYADCIKACYWIPFAGFSGGSSQAIYLGDYYTGVAGLVQGSKIVSQSFNINIPWPETDWKKNNCMAQIYLPFCGTVVLPIDKIIDFTVVTVTVSLDVVGGTIAYRVSAGGVTIATTGANVGAPYAIGSSNITMQSVMQGASVAVGGGIQAASGAAAAAATGGAIGVGGAVGGVTSIASGVAQAITPMVQSVGSMGGNAAAGLLTYIRLELLYYPPIAENLFRAEFGYPVMNTQTPGAGYNMCRGFSVDCGGSPDEIAQINSMMNTGAYVE